MIKKLLIGVAIVFGVLTTCMVLIVWMVASTNKPKGNREEILQSNQQLPKKALIVYQPAITDITSRMAHQIAKGLNDGGYEVTLNYPGEHLSTDISQYSLIVFGSPAYGGNPLSIVTDYMSRIKDFSSKRIVLYSTGANPDSLLELDNMEKFLNSTKAHKKIKFFVSANKENDKIAYDLGKELSKE
ncbi:MAG: flavodoxin [Clostridia bacterium]|jgi:flavorubredoxin|uniref:flavodoxin n=1 Tax=Petroclostridium xylanilyticum TaxID=1792311 RepID=UPI000B97F432|nr:flavodoxin [Petroclostridium xylanilyticum]MBZ4646014.1 flavodoxin [Clostridia bacterium]